MGYKELIDTEFKKINDQYTKKIDIIMNDYEANILKLKEEYNKKNSVLDKAFNDSKFTQKEYSCGKVLLDKKIKEEIDALRKNMEKEIEDAKKIIASNRNVVIRDVCKSIEEKLKQKYNIQHDELEEKLKENKVKISEAEKEIEVYSQNHKNDIKELAQKEEEERNNSISKMKEFQTSKLKMECVYIPEEKKQQFIEYIQMGVIPVKLLDSLELLTARESIEKKVLEDIEVKYNNEKIELEKQLEEKNKNKMKEKQLLQKGNEEIEQKIKQLEEKHKKEISEITDMKKKYEDGPELV